ncbi:hypothetical protein F3H77_07470 [Enterobacter hormaechei]|nr:hypothetical protein [Enterobacter hormaechei]MBE8834517.1 hypothetical protein [Enterobacter hormaechei]MBE8961531.1 hypothetical protein [Enterobacter hormaechei]OUK82471.1 hypothetical protein BZY51_04015 [Enterobacter hormaechei]PCO71691.1 hypothetical protein CP997_01110 [Enterobacter hormaechei]
MPGVDSTTLLAGYRLRLTRPTILNLKFVFLQATKNPSTLNQNGGVDGLHKLGTSKKSSGTSYDCTLRKKFCA